VAKWKEKPKYNVVSIRVSDEEKAFMDNLKHKTQKSTSTLLREAIRLLPLTQRV
jgi:predicted DNA-binding protein